MNQDWIAPSILSADFTKLGQEVDQVIQAGAQIIHFDVMDNHYVPNLTIGPLVCSSLKKYNENIIMDVHLMIEPVDTLIPSFAESGADFITFHPEATKHIDRTIELIRDCGCKPGLAFNPATPLDYLIYTLHKIDMVLLMTVNPGFGGQEFIQSVLPKIEAARQLIDRANPSIRLEIDGGVNTSNIRSIKEAGADTFVAGSAIFHSTDYQETINAMNKEISAVTG